MLSLLARFYTCVRLSTYNIYIYMYLFGTPRRALSLLARQQRQESFSLVQYLTGTGCHSP